MHVRSVFCVALVVAFVITAMPRSQGQDPFLTEQPANPVRQPREREATNPRLRTAQASGTPARLETSLEVDLNGGESDIRMAGYEPGSTTYEPNAEWAPGIAAEAENADLQSQFLELKNEFESFKTNLAKPKFPSVEVHGAAQADTAWFTQDANSRATVGDIQDGGGFRRTRLSANGAIAENMNYFVQMDFSFFGRPTFTDVWFEVTKVPVFGNVRIGQWKQPFSLEVVSSFRYTTFAERSLLFQSFVPFRHVAIGFYDWSEDEMTTWAASIYHPGQDQFGNSIGDNGNVAFVGRMTHLMWHECEGSSYLHVGAAYNWVGPANRTARFRTIPEYFVGEVAGGGVGTSGQAVTGVQNGTPFFVDTLAFGVNHYNLFGAELLWVEGPFSLQSEAMVLSATRPGGADTVNFPGGYVQAGYFLTGEHRPYLKKAGAIDRIKVLRPLFWGDEGCNTGWGGWEIASRLSAVKLNDNDIRGGQLTDYTFGINWYLNSYSKIQLNYVHAFLDNPVRGRSDTDIYGARAQFDF